MTRSGRRNGILPGRRIGVLLAGVGVALGLLALGHRIPTRVSDVWPLDLAHPGEWLIDRRIAETARDPALCRKVLASGAVVARPIADNAGPGSCGWQNAVRLSSAGHARLDAAAVSCGETVALALWLTHVVQPMAQAHLGARVATVDHLGAYACRNIRGSPVRAGQPSEHAAANALDVSGFRLTDGRRIQVARQWGEATPEGRFLEAIHAGACRYFRVAIGPRYNAAHRDHFHLDRGEGRLCR